MIDPNLVVRLSWIASLNGLSLMTRYVLHVSLLSADTTVADDSLLRQAKDV
jgi:hypothetical protein